MSWAWTWIWMSISGVGGALSAAPWGWMVLTFGLWFWPTWALAAEPVARSVANVAQEEELGALREQALTRERLLVGVEPEQAAPGVGGWGESNGFGHAFGWLGEHWLVTSPRSFELADRAGALWFGLDGDGQRWRLVHDSPARAWQALGMALGISARFADGRQRVAVGAPLAPGDGWDPGMVELFRVRGSSLRWMQTLVPPAPSAAGGFGSELLWQGERLWIAAPFASGPGGALQAGRLTVWERGSAGWRMAEQHLGPASSAGQRFGEALAQHADHLFVGAPGDRGRGAVFVFDDQGSGLSVMQVLRPEGLAWLDSHFGADLALSADGQWLFVGAPEAPHGGAVQVYRRNARGDFVPNAVWRDEHGLGARGFGSSLAFHLGELWVGAPRGAGAVWRFPAPFDGPSVSQAWLGRTARAALGRAIEAREDRVFVSAPGEGIASEHKPPRGTLWELPRGRHAYASQGRGQGLRWVGDATAGGVLRAWGLAARERVEVRWVGQPSGTMRRAEGDGSLWVPTPGPPGLEPILELRRSAGRTWRLPLGAPGGD